MGLLIVRQMKLANEFEREVFVGKCYDLKSIQKEIRYTTKMVYPGGLFVIKMSFMTIVTCFFRDFSRP